MQRLFYSGVDPLGDFNIELRIHNDSQYSKTILHLYTSTVKEIYLYFKHNLNNLLLNTLTNRILCGDTCPLNIPSASLRHD